MGDQVNNLRKENEELKKQISEVKKDLHFIKKGATGNIQYGGSMGARSKEQFADYTDHDGRQPLVIAQSNTLPNANDVQYLSDGYDWLIRRLEDLELKVNVITEKADRIAKAIDEFQLYSYQYNLKLVGVPQIENETADDTVGLCLKIFSGIGADTTKWDIDTAHRVPMRNQNGRRRQTSQPTVHQPIICKFTRRIARDHVLSKRRVTNLLEPDEFGLQPGSAIKIRIFNHLTPRLQELLHSAKIFQAQESYKFCWAKGTAVFLRKTENAKPIRLNTAEDLEQLRIHEGYGAAGGPSREESERMACGRGRGANLDFNSV